MPLGTLDRTPPPFFKQGPSALTKLVFFSALALFLMVADTRFKVTMPLRSLVATVLNPIERGLLAPIRALVTAGDYFSGITEARTREAEALEKAALMSERSLRAEQVAAENAQLRQLLDLRAAISVRSIPAELLYEAADPFSRKVFIDRGAIDGVVPGAPVIDEVGVLGQVTRVYPMSSEVTLLVDKEASIPVLNTRTRQRSAAFGADGTRLELRFMAGNSDVRVGDLLQTSGIDGVYPPGLDVARVVKVDPSADSSFARISLLPVATADDVRHVLVLEPMAMQLPPRPAEEASEGPAAASAPRGPRPIRGTKR